MVPKKKKVPESKVMSPVEEDEEFDPFDEVEEGYYYEDDFEEDWDEEWDEE
ncbi:hypothetical protein [Thermococcus sp. CX2]|uniref:hypothetical protein n=1 Tax=Thermococcus sp. CX2 TaxID=163006 RepID=UPI00143BE02D|nr:hypothetical protein [Thermococcus sp. CX2]